MFRPSSNPYLVPFDENFRLKDSSTSRPHGFPDKKECVNRLEGLVKELADFQRMLYAQGKHSLLLIFKAMDAAGKDSTIRAVMSGVDPSGCQVFAFKAPSTLERAHDFL